MGDGGDRWRGSSRDEIVIFKAPGAKYIEKNYAELTEEM
jgi:hypothetical protein